MEPLTLERALTSWTLAPEALVVAAAGLLVMRRRSALVAAAAWLLATCSFLGVYNHELFWVLAVQDVVLLALVPIPVVLAGGLRWRVPPAVGAVLGVATLVAIYTTGWDEGRLEHRLLFVSTQLLLVAVGSLFLGPLLDPHGGRFAGRAFVAFAEGLLDAVPGLVVLGTHGLIARHWYSAHPRAWGPAPRTDQQIGGTAMVVLSELVGLPALVLLVVRWIRADATEAQRIDTELDDDDAASGTPWWERDAGPLRDRARREGW